MGQRTHFYGNRATTQAERLTNKAMAKGFKEIEIQKLTSILLITISLFIIFSGCNKEKEEGPFVIVRGGGEREPAFSPDGKFIAYSTGEIWLFEIATGESEYLTDGLSPDWSPDGKWILYVKGRDIYKINVETKVIKQLTTWGSCFYPDWAPDGKRIAFDTSHDDPKGANVIWLMDSNGTNYKDISIHGIGEWREPDWSPSGDKIVHIRYVGVTFPEIFIMDSAGQNSVRLTNNQTIDFSPVWSPDGSKIAYVGETRNEKNWSCYNIWVMDTTGNNKIQLTFEPEGKNWSGAFDPAWSFDGSQIAYARCEKFVKREGGETVYEYIWHIWIMDSDGENKRQLTGEARKIFGCK